MVEYLKAQQSETKVAEVDMLTAVWAAIMGDVDWTAKPELLEGLALKSIKVCCVSRPDQTSMIAYTCFVPN
jgi:hypothetical protein